MARQPKIDKKRAMNPKPNNKSGENPYNSPSKLGSGGASILPLTYVALSIMGDKGSSPYQKKQAKRK